MCRVMKQKCETTDNIFSFNEKTLKQKEAQELGKSLLRPIVFYLLQNWRKKFLK